MDTLRVVTNPSRRPANWDASKEGNGDQRRWGAGIKPGPTDVIPARGSHKPVDIVLGSSGAATTGANPRKGFLGRGEAKSHG